MTAYLDSSAAVKIFLDDEGDDFDLDVILAAFGSVTTSRLTFVETRAALAAARRDGRLAAPIYNDAIVEFDRMWRTFYVVDMSSDVALDAGEVAETFGLRAGDAVQLASLRALGFVNAPLIAWDTRLRAAATASGFACYPLEI